MKYKVNMLTKSNTSNEAALLQKLNLKYLKEYFPLLYIEVSIFKALAHLIDGSYKESILTLSESFKFLNTFIKFKSCHQVCQYLRQQSVLIKHLLLLLFAYSNIKIDNFILSFLSLSNENFIGLNRNNNIAIEKILSVELGFLRELNMSQFFKEALGKVKAVESSQTQKFYDSYICNLQSNSTVEHLNGSRDLEKLLKKI